MTKKTIKLVLGKDGNIVKKAGHTGSDLQLNVCPRCKCKDATVVPPEENGALWMVKCDECGFHLEHANLAKLKMAWDSQSQRAWFQHIID